MNFQVILTDEAQKQLDALARSDATKHRKVLRTLGVMATNLRSPGLNTHAFISLSGPNKEKAFEFLCRKQYSCRVPRLLVLWSRPRDYYGLPHYPSPMNLSAR